MRQGTACFTQQRGCPVYFLLYKALKYNNFAWHWNPADIATYNKSLHEAVDILLWALQHIRLTCWQDIRRLVQLQRQGFLALFSYIVLLSHHNIWT